MGIWDFWTTKSVDYVHGLLKPEQCPGSVGSSELVAGDHYVSVHLERMRIVDVRRGLKRFYGAVHSDVGIVHGSGAMTSFAQMIAPPELKDVDPKNFDRTILAHQALFGPSPYRGGPLQLNAALLTIQSAELLGPYLDVLADLADSAGVAFVSVAKPYLEPLRKGIDLLSGSAGDQSLEVYLVANIPDPREGAYVVTRVPQGQLSFDSLKLQDDFTLEHAGQPLVDYPYFVITISAEENRPDWRAVPEVGAAYESVRDTLLRDQPQEIEEAMAFFRRTVLLNDDLLEDHADALIQQVESRKNAILDASKTGAAEISVPTLAEFDPFDK